MSRQEIMAELREWKQLLDEGLVTQEQYNEHQQHLLTRLKGLSSSGVGSKPSTNPSPVAHLSETGQTPSGADFFGTGGGSSGGNLKSRLGEVLAERYKLEKLLGEGGMGEVYKATDLLMGNVCALKWIKPELAASPPMRKRFVNELRVTQRLSHPGIVRTYNLMQDKSQGALFFTMEFVEGNSLEELLVDAGVQGKIPPFPIPKALAWLRQVAESLEVAHKAGVLHRDLKPANVMVDIAGKTRLMDFGISKSAGGHTTLHTGFVGTPVYMPPEQLKGGKATRASDLYSFGVLLYQTLTGELPSGRFEEPQELVGEIPSWANALVMKCLERKPERRFQSVAELLVKWENDLSSPKRAAPVSTNLANPTHPDKPQTKVPTKTQRTVLKNRDVPGEPSASPPKQQTKATPTAVAKQSLPKKQRPLVAGLSQQVPALPEAVEIYCPAGKFRMGSSPREKGVKFWEKPAREVSLSRGLWALSTQVTQSMYESVMGTNPSHFSGARKPVDSVTWWDAIVFCNKLSAKTGLRPAYVSQGVSGVLWDQTSDGWRLPTEAEWEYLARAGSTEPRYGEVDKVAWTRQNSQGGTHPVGEKEPNAWGFYDTLGNVWEWCADEWSEEAYCVLSSQDPAHLPSTIHERVRRGGAWSYFASGARASFRDRHNAEQAFYYSGFRCVRTASDKAK